MVALMAKGCSKANNKMDFVDTHAVIGHPLGLLLWVKVYANGLID
jgi:hypothetical protein